MTFDNAMPITATYRMCTTCGEKGQKKYTRRCIACDNATLLTYKETYIEPFVDVAFVDVLAIHMREISCIDTEKSFYRSLNRFMANQ